VSFSEFKRLATRRDKLEITLHCAHAATASPSENFSKSDTLSFSTLPHPSARASINLSSPKRPREPAVRRLNKI
jgi:hypothetical protein